MSRIYWVTSAGDEGTAKNEIHDDKDAAEIRESRQKQITSTFHDLQDLLYFQSKRVIKFSVRQHSNRHFFRMNLTVKLLQRA
jgi:hypothetical protein